MLTGRVEDPDTEGQRLCYDCVGETVLRAKIEKDGQDGICFYCGFEGKTFSIGEMADEIEIALEEHYYLTPTESSYMEYVMAKESEYDWEREGDLVAEVIGWCAELELAPAEDIRIVLSERHFDMELRQMGEEGPFDHEAHYAGKEVDDAESQASWSYFEESLKTHARYFNRALEDTLTSIFVGISEQMTIDGHSVIVEAGPGMGHVHISGCYSNALKLITGCNSTPLGKARPVWPCILSKKPTPSTSTMIG